MPTSMSSLSTISIDEEIRLPRELVAAMQDFPGAHRMLAVWRRYPDLLEDEDRATDHWAAHEASVAFVAFLADCDIEARLVVATGSRAPLHDRHWWVRINCPLATVNVDWTARQFHNLFYPPMPDYADLPYPTVWLTGPVYPADTHPLTGRYAAVTDSPTTSSP
jgi:hypothetical protein